jgi:hypothetical protein
MRTAYGVDWASRARLGRAAVSPGKRGRVVAGRAAVGESEPGEPEAKRVRWATGFDPRAGGVGGCRKEEMERGELDDLLKDVECGRDCAIANSSWRGMVGLEFRALH